MAKDSVKKLEIPGTLIEAVKSTRVIPFLGAGASKEASDGYGKTPPDADALRDLLASKFFGKDIKNRDLMTVAEMAIASAGGQSLVFEEIRKILSPFEPGDAHRALAEFRWRSIATTNYDLLIERAYSDVKTRRQNLVRFVKDDEPVEQRLQETHNPLQYLKLHGCVDHIHDSDIPLILTKESYARFSKNRTRLFDRIKDYSHESSILFIGYRLDDPHIRDLIYNLAPTKRPRWYMVTPDAEDYDVSYWDSQNVGVIKSRFGDFMSALQEEIPPLFRALSPSLAVADLPIRKFYVTSNVESARLRDSLNTDFAVIHSGMSAEEQIPKLFYEGYDNGWGGILRRLDVRRKVEDDLLYKAVLENESPKGPVLLVLRGPAGAGKTIALKRTAFEAATSSNVITLWLEEGGSIHIGAIAELYELCQKPIYLFVDQIGFHVGKILNALREAKAKSIPLVVIGAERDADWNTYCYALDNEFPPNFVRVGNLSEPEVQGLLDLLERHDCLGLLKRLNRDQQVQAFMNEDKADRQLLVALHELTRGKPFEAIVLEEHERISPEQARQLHLDIATMHQFSVHVRAGIISRISGISFTDFQEEFLEPLKNIVRVDNDPYSGDLSYRTRHARVASIVFRQVCPDDVSKAKQLTRLIGGLDVGYSVDKRALEEITKGRALADAFSGIADARLVYEAAIKSAPKQAFLYQQWALLEANHPQGSLLEAEKLAEEAHGHDPKSKAIIHTQAEIDRRRAILETSDLLKDTLRRRSRIRLAEMPSNDRFAVSSRCKMLVDELDELGSSIDENSRQHEVMLYAEKLKVTEEAISRAQQNHPDDADLIQVEARLRRVTEEEDKALRALERALLAGVRGSGTAIRVAQMYETRNREFDAGRTLKEALARSPDDKPLHEAMAIHLLSRSETDLGLVGEHLRRSYSVGDRNFEARFNLAQLLFIAGDVPNSKTIFEEIDKFAPDTFRRATPVRDNIFTIRLSEVTGSVQTIKGSFLFIRSAAYPTDIFAHRNLSNYDDFDDLEIGQEVSFKIRFNRTGPTAVAVMAARSRRSQVVSNTAEVS